MNINDKPFAVIDIGSNTVRLVIFNGLNSGFIPLYNERVQCGLGKDLTTTGNLSPESIVVAINAVQRFKIIAESMGATIEVFATAAVREANDQKYFINKLLKLGIKITVLSGADEAKFSSAGVFSSFLNINGFMGDLGGGSLELVGSHNNISEIATLPIGTLRQPSIHRREEKLIKKLDEMFSTIEWLSKYKNQAFYLVGGAWRALAKLHMNQCKYPISIIHNYTINFDEALNFCKILSILSSSSIDAISTISKERRKTLPYAAIVLERILYAAQPKSLIFSSYGLREGFLQNYLTISEKRKDPLLTSCRMISKKESRFGEMNKTLLFLKPIFLSFPESELRLIEAVSLLSDIGWSVHPDSRAESAFNRIINSPLVAIDHSERIYLAISIMTRYRGNLSKKKYVSDFLHPEKVKRAKIVGASFDLAYAITGGVDSSIDSFSLKYNYKTIILNNNNDNNKLLAGEIVKKRINTLCKYLRCKYSIIY
tara:strand:- start:309 stop:1763 length:1455 start_codon:yes stop_codon:yes gene_type:complete